MAKFNVLESNQSFMAKLGIYSYKLTEPVNKFFKSFMTYYMLFSLILICVILSAMGVYVNWPNIVMVLEAFLTVVTGSQCAGIFISLGLNMKKIKTVHLKLQEIVDEESEAFNIYWNIEQKCRKYTKLMGSYTFSNQIMLMPPLYSFIRDIMAGKMETSNWTLPFTIGFPFSTESVWAWYLKWLAQLHMSVAYAACISAATSYFLCCCLYIGAICDHFKLNMHSIKKNAKQNSKEQNPLKCHQNSLIIQQKLIKAVEIHFKLYE